MLKYILFLLLPVGVFAAELSQCIPLLNRISFGVDKKQLSACLQTKDMEEYIKDVIYRPRNIDEMVAPNYARKPSRPYKKFSELNATERRTFLRGIRAERNKLRSWWFKKMITTNDPYLERMTLFWHTLFTSESRKTKQPMVMYRQNQLFRRNAFGNYGKLLHSIIEDPAMLIYLDNKQSKKGHPNENLGRELLELFSMGEGHYTEKDIQEFSRALTGFSVDRNFKFKFKKRIHDDGEKSFLGHTGDLSAHDMIDIILEQDATAKYVVTKLWKYLVSYDIDKSQIDRLAKLFRKNHYKIKPLLMAMLTSDEFRSPSNKGKMIKSPIDLIVGTLRSFGYRDFDPALGVKYARRLGQFLLDPPNVKGWKGGTEWITADTLLTRRDMLSKLTRGDAMEKLHYDIFDLSSAKTPHERAAQILLPLHTYVTPAANTRQTIRMMLLHPLYQLK